MQWEWSSLVVRPLSDTGWTPLAATRQRMEIASQARIRKIQAVERRTE